MANDQQMAATDQQRSKVIQLDVIVASYTKLQSTSYSEEQGFLQLIS